jgi:hypothetical protein
MPFVRSGPARKLRISGVGMSDIDQKILETIASQNGSCSLFELMSLLSGIPDSEIKAGVESLQSKEIVKVKSTNDEADPLITIREKALQDALKVA